MLLDLPKENPVTPPRSRHLALCLLPPRQGYPSLQLPTRQLETAKRVQRSFLPSQHTSNDTAASKIFNLGS